ncbi:MAG: hypothetical protein JJU29_08055 [Verrucomicrobia bacterium]|nr:hypothetical protein [Verrucomicrobiota bacterium]MCH8511882.1 hypothetical protein [Kiritimatiellia bacterium]
MPIGAFEAEILRLLAANRNPESFIGGATVLNQPADSPRASEDIDVFHDSEASLQKSVEQDLRTLHADGFEVSVLLSRPSFHRAQVSKESQTSKIEWVHDSAFRFFPVETDDLMGYRLNLWDAATNKVLAGVGRGVVRDYVDLIYLHESRLSLGALIWAAAGKDPGLNPDFIREEMMRTQRYDPQTYQSLKLSRPVDPFTLKKIWLEAIREARDLFDLLLDMDAPYGCFFLNDKDVPQTPTRETLATLRPHYGSLRGCWPRIVEEEGQTS